MQRLIVIPTWIYVGGLAQGTGSTGLPGHWLIDTGTMLMRVSAGFCKVLGIGRTFSLPFQSFLELVHPGDRHRVETLVSTAPPKSATIFEELIRIVNPNGAVKSVAFRGEIRTDHGRRRRDGTAGQATVGGQGGAPSTDCAERERFGSLSTRRRLCSSSGSGRMEN